MSRSQAPAAQLQLGDVVVVGRAACAVVSVSADGLCSVLIILCMFFYVLLWVVLVQECRKLLYLSRSVLVFCLPIG